MIQKNATELSLQNERTAMRTCGVIGSSTTLTLGCFVYRLSTKRNIFRSF